REDLLEIGTFQAGFFPRFDGSRLVLSQVDNLLLSCVGDQWSTPVDVFVRRSAAGEELREWASHTGDVFVATRLRAWARHNEVRAALDREPHRPERRMLEERYRLSTVGQKIMRDGLDEIAQGVPLAVGGVVAYDPLAPWVVVNGAADQPGLRMMP